MWNSTKAYLTEDRLDRGYVLVLPGIEGRSFWNRSIVRGLIRAKLPYAIEIHDWTLTRFLILFHLRSKRLHRRRAAEIGAKILNYQRAWPGRPVYLIGHSGGGAMALRSLEALPEETTITGAVLLGAAMSPGYDVRPALAHVEDALWNVTSRGDFLFLGMLTTIAGSIDGQHGPCAGMLGFHRHQLTPQEAAKLQELPYRWEYLRGRNLAGHFGYTAAPFVRRWIAPLLLPRDDCQKAVVEPAVLEQTTC